MVVSSGPRTQAVVNVGARGTFGSKSGNHGVNRIRRGYKHDDHERALPRCKSRPAPFSVSSSTPDTYQPRSSGPQTPGHVPQKPKGDWQRVLRFYVRALPLLACTHLTLAHRLTRSLFTASLSRQENTRFFSLQKCGQTGQKNSSPCFPVDEISDGVSSRNTEPTRSQRCLSKWRSVLVGLNTSVTLERDVEILQCNGIHTGGFTHRDSLRIDFLALGKHS